MSSDSETAAEIRKLRRWLGLVLLTGVGGFATWKIYENHLENQREMGRYSPHSASDAKLKAKYNELAKEYGK